MFLKSALRVIIAAHSMISVDFEFGYAPHCITFFRCTKRDHEHYEGQQIKEDIEKGYQLILIACGNKVVQYSTLVIKM